jgi:hypothetical protein
MALQAIDNRGRGIESNGIGGCGSGLPSTLSGLDHIEKQIAGAIEELAGLEAKLGPVLTPPSPLAAEVRSDPKLERSALRERLENLSRGMVAVHCAIARISERIDL